ncbi:aroma-sacti cluster domain-containing protein [Actinospica robiniae]|uniref:aroma-sacti cluster domain-containing protein n=1 Tax=Actinospica robiniae TaxID=304901 RepID=UPI0003FFAEA0|nr:aroma-sacti cluster domain-containing protein [Actinospica robiniae]
MKDPLEALRAAGCPVDLLSEAQRLVLAALTEQETELLVSVQQRLRAAEGEVTGHDWKML